MRTGEELLLVDEALWLLRSRTGVSAYDFPIDRFSPCRRRWQRASEVEVVGRVGAFEDYAARYEGLLGSGMRLVHTPEEHRRCSDLTRWYPPIESMTPRSVWLDEAPDAGESVGGLPALRKRSKGLATTSHEPSSRTRPRHSRTSGWNRGAGPGLGCGAGRGPRGFRFRT